MKQAGIAHRF